MNAPQYRNFGTYQTLVCCHTVDVDATDHAGIRWYELRKTTGTWSLRQSGTYAPDAHSRWMGSIRLNGQGELGLGYSISSTSLFPGIRYTGQTATAYAAGAGTLDLAEQTVVTGTYAQTAYNRWGDYSAISIDPTDDKTFWYTTEYIGTSSARKTRVCSFQVGSAPAQPDLVVQSAAAAPASVQDGGSVTATGMVYNQGTAAAIASTAKYYLSADNTYSAGDVLLGSDAIAALNAASGASVNKSLTIPAGTAPGTWYLIFVSDADAQVTEVNELNNNASVQITVTSAAGSPDLVVQSPAATPVTITAGLTTSASCTVLNNGPGAAAASNLKYYLSTDNAYGAGDVYLATSATAALASGGSAALSGVLTIPSNTAAGSYFILYVADADAQVPESNEANNTGSVAVSVQVVITGCNSTTQYPSTTLSVTTNWKSQKSIWAGEYTVINVTSGLTYVFSYCSADGATASYNSEMTLRNKSTDAFIAYSDDACGDDAKIQWTATFTGQVKLVTTVSGCGTNSISTTLRYKRLAKSAETGEDIQAPEYSVYPNPTTGRINVEAASGFESVKTIQVFNPSGRVVRSMVLPEKPENIYTFDLGDQPEGYYVVVVKGSDFSRQIKVLVNR